MMKRFLNYIIVAICFCLGYFSISYLTLGKSLIATLLETGFAALLEVFFLCRLAFPLSTMNKVKQTVTTVFYCFFICCSLFIIMNAARYPVNVTAIFALLGTAIIWFNSFCNAYLPSSWTDQINMLDKKGARNILIYQYLVAKPVMVITGGLYLYAGYKNLPNDIASIMFIAFIGLLIMQFPLQKWLD